MLKVDRSPTLSKICSHWIDSGIMVDSVIQSWLFPKLSLQKINSAQSDKHNSKPQCMSLSPGCRHGSFQPHGSLGNRTHDFLQGRLGGEQITFSVPSSSTIIAKGEITYWLCNHEDDLKGIAKRYSNFSLILWFKIWQHDLQ